MAGKMLTTGDIIPLGSQSVKQKFSVPKGKLICLNGRQKKEGRRMNDDRIGIEYF